MTIFTKIWSFIASLFHKIDAETKLLVPISINVVQAVKAFMDSPGDDILVYVIDFVTKGVLDPAIVSKINETIKAWLPKVLIELAMVDSIANITDQNEQLKAILAQFKLSSDESKNILWHGLGSLILEKISDGRLSWSDAIAIEEYYYNNFIKTQP